MAFDPNAYLASSPTSSGGFDPDAYLANQPHQTQQQPFYQDVADVINSAKSAVANSSIGQGVGKVASTIAPAADIAGKLASIVTPGSGIPELAQQLAPSIAQGEGQAVSDAGLKAGYPLSGAAVGTGVTMIPNAINAYVGWKGLHNIDNPVVKGLVNTPQELGPEYNALDTKAGVSDDLPVQRGTIPKWPGLNGLPQNVPPPEAPNIAPSIYPKDTKTYLNFVRNRIDAMKDNLTPQELSDHKTLLGDIMTNMKANGQSGTKIFAKAAQAGSDITDLQNTNVPGRIPLNQAYRISKTQAQIAPLINHYLGVGAKIGGTVGGIGAGAYELYKKLTGQHQ